MNAMAAVEDCTAKCGSGAGLTFIPVTVTQNLKGEWEAWPNPIVLDNPNVKVVWDLAEVLGHPWGSPVQDVTIEFTKGPSGPPTYSPTLGPFGSITPDLFPTPPTHPTLTGLTQMPPYGPCYCYNLVVKLGVDKKQLFPVDPQIDNLAPPGTCPGEHDYDAEP